MRRPSWALIAALVAAVAAVPLPGLVSTPVLGDLTAAVALAGPAAGAAVAVAAGRPLLAAAAFSGTGAYVSGILAVRGFEVPVAVLAGTAAAAAAGTVIALVANGLRPMNFLALSLVAAAGGGALILAESTLTGGEAGLGSIPGLRIPLSGGAVAVLGPGGSFHAVLAVAAAATVVSALLLARGPGPRWRAAGGDPERASGTAISVLRAQVEALAVAGALSGACGAMAAHAATVASPSVFGVDAAVLPLAAALLAGRSGPAAAALLAVAAGVAGRAVLPAAGYSGPPSAEAVATAVLAAGVVVRLLARRRRTAALSAAVDLPDPEAPWPEVGPRGGVCDLVVAGLDVRAGGDGPALVTGLRFEVRSGQVHGLVGPNGAGKSTVLRAIATQLRGGGERATLLPRLVNPGPGRGAGEPPDPDPRGPRPTRLDGAKSATATPPAGPQSAPPTPTAGARGASPLGAPDHPPGAAPTRRSDRAQTGRRRRPPRPIAALLPQGGGGLEGCTVAETLRLAARAGGGGPHDWEAWRDRLGLATVAASRSEDLPAGARRRLELGRVLLLRPAALLCDEPLAGLDPAERELAVSGLGAAAAAGVTIVLAEHDRTAVAQLASATTELSRDSVAATTELAR